MLPDKLSTYFTSLNFNEDRLLIVVEMVIGADESLQESGESLMNPLFQVSRAEILSALEAYDLGGSEKKLVLDL